MSSLARSDRFLPAIVVCLTLATPDGARAALNRWTPLGDPVGSAVTRVAFDPRDPSTMYAQGAGLWRSTDGGSTWTPISEGLDAAPLELEVDAAGTLFVSAADWESLYTYSLWRSEDRGATWSEVQTERISYDFGPELAVDPMVPGTVYWVLQQSAYKSTDGGLTFACFQGFCASGSWPIAFGLAVDPHRPSAIYCSADAVLYKTTDGGATWTEPAFIQPFFNSELVDRIAPSSDPAVLYVWRNEPGAGVPLPCFARSDDGGETWKGYLLGERCGEPAVDPAEPRTVRIVVGRELWMSRDGGETWTKAPVPTSGSVFHHPTDLGVLFLAGEGGLFKSADGGATWASSDQGIRSSATRLLVPSPQERGVLYAGIAAPAAGSDFSWMLHKSTNSGQSWTKLPLRNPLALAVDPRDPEHLMAADFPQDWSRVLESVDGGRSWSVLARMRSVARLVFDPRDSSTLYAGTPSEGVLKSTDGGRTWRGSNQGLPLVTRCEARYCPPNEVRELLVDPRDPRTLYITFQGYVYRSADGGETWAWASRGLPDGRVSDVVALAVDPARPGLLYAAVGVRVPGAVFKSFDGGRRWVPVAALPGIRIDGQEAPPGVRDLVVTPSGVFVATWGRGVVRSADGGRSWTVVSRGLPLPFVDLLEADPLFPERLYAATSSLGLYSARFKGTR